MQGKRAKEESAEASTRGKRTSALTRTQLYVDEDEENDDDSEYNPAGEHDGAVSVSSAGELDDDDDGSSVFSD